MKKQEIIGFAAVGAISAVVAVIIWPMAFHPGDTVNTPMGNLGFVAMLATIIAASAWIGFFGALSAKFFRLICKSYRLKHPGSKTQNTLGVLPGSTNIVANNIPVTVPIFHVFDHRSEQPFFPNVTRHAFTYKQATATFTPKPSTPGRHKYETNFFCPICKQRIPIAVTQITMLPIPRPQLIRPGGLYDLLILWRTVVVSSPFLKLFILAVCSFFISLLIFGFLIGQHVVVERSNSTQLLLWGAVAAVMICSYVVYIGARILSSKQILLRVRKPGDFGYSDPRCVNIIRDGTIPHETPHSAHLSPGGPKLFLFRDMLVAYGYKGNAWIVED